MTPSKAQARMIPATQPERSGAVDEVTAPVRRAAKALANAVANDLYASSSTGGHIDMLGKYDFETFRDQAERIGGIVAEHTAATLSAALDVEEMARVMCTRTICDGSKKSCPDHSVNIERATALRIAILGGAA